MATFEAKEAGGEDPTYLTRGASGKIFSLVCRARIQSSLGQLEG